LGRVVSQLNLLYTLTDSLLRYFFKIRLLSRRAKDISNKKGKAVPVTGREGP
jgi:hypothetical protein